MDEVPTSPVYFDYNATTPLDRQVIDEIRKSLIEDWGNPSSSHLYGKKAKNVIEQSRLSVAQMLNANAEDIVFTSGGTESNNVALLSVIGSSKDSVPHVISTNVEHDSVALVLKEQELLGHIEWSTANVNDNGQLSIENVLSLIRDNTRLISVMHANNETGVIMPVAQIGEELEKVNEIRVKNDLDRIFFHCDASQAIGKIKVDVQEMKVDLLTVVGHKFYGPRVGALFVKNVLQRTTPLKPLLNGGGQERDLRPGTENTPMIAGLGKAAQLVYENLETYHADMKRLKQSLSAKLVEGIPGVKVNFTMDEVLPNTLSICLPIGLQAYKVLNTNCEGKLLASLGAACHSNEEKPSVVLLASGLSPSEAARTIRLSVGRTTTQSEIDTAVKVLIEACSQLQS